MAMKQANIERGKSVAGILLVGLGILILRAELNQAVTYIQNLIGNASSGTLAMALVDEAQKTFQANGTGFSRLLQPMVQQVFLSAWPLLLVRIGMELSTEVRR
jgi:hypothetical protein